MSSPLPKPLRTSEDLHLKTLTLAIDDRVKDKFIWLLEHFSRDEIRILDQSDQVSDDDYLRSIDGMVNSIQEARNEPAGKGIGPDQLDW